jgi:hypothetical protein
MKNWIKLIVILYNHHFRIHSFLDRYMHYTSAKKIQINEVNTEASKYKYAMLNNLPQVLKIRE